MIDAGDIIRIHQLLGRYGHTIDHRQWDAFANLFTEDASIDYKGGTGVVERHSRAAIVDWFRSIDASHPPAHHVTNIVVEDEADPTGPVRVHSKFIAPYTRDHHDPKRLYGGDYHDIVVKTDDGWKFSHKQCLPRWNVTITVDEDVVEHRRTF